MHYFFSIYFVIYNRSSFAFAKRCLTIDVVVLKFLVSVCEPAEKVVTVFITKTVQCGSYI